MRRGRAVVIVVGAMCVIVLLALRLAAYDKPASVVTVGDDLPTVPTTVPPVTVPELPQPVDPGTLEDGWYLILSTKILTTEDAPLLAAAQQLVIQAKGVGYRDAKIIPSPGGKSECGDWGCIEGGPPMGYTVLLKGPYPVPNWADLDEKFAWHQQLQAQEQQQAGVLGLTATPGLELFTFSEG